MPLLSYFTNYHINCFNHQLGLVAFNKQDCSESVLYIMIHTTCFVMLISIIIFLCDILGFLDK